MRIESLKVLPWWMDATPLVLFVLIILAANLWGIDSGQSISADATSFHYPELSHFLAKPLGFESSPGLSGPIPGYHWFQSNIAHLFGANDLGAALPIIRFSHFVVALVGITTIILTLRALTRGSAAGPVLASLIAIDFYYLQASYYFNTEAPAYTLLSLMLALLVADEKCPTDVAGGQAGVIGLGLVLTRHPCTPALAGAALYFAIAKRWNALARLLVFAVISGLILACYQRFWGGLVSPYWQKRQVVSGFFPHSLAHVFALAGVFAPFFLATLWGKVVVAACSREFRAVTAALCILVVGLWLWADTNASSEAQRQFSIVWGISAIFPTLGKKSPAVLLLMLLSVPSFSLMITNILREQRLFPEFLVLGFLLCSQILHNLPFQRYVEVPLIMMFTIFTARYVEVNLRSITPLCVLVASYGCLSIIRFFGVF